MAGLSSGADALDIAREKRRRADQRLLDQALSSYLTTSAQLKATGRPMTGQEKPGPISKFFDLIGRLGEGSRGALFSLANATPETAAMNPLQAAVEGFRGNLEGSSFSDLPMLQARPDDNLGERGSKFLAALAGDIATDPISYVAAPSSLGRKAAASLAYREAPQILKTITEAGGDDAAKLVEELAGQSRLRQAATAQEEAGRLGSLVSPRESAIAPLPLSKAASAEELASMELGNRIVDALVKRGRKGVFDELVTLTGSEENARKVMMQLPEAVRGGLFWANPISGRPLARINPNSTGEGLGILGEIANKGRFETAATLGAKISKGMGGRTGEAYADFLQNLRKGNKSMGAGRFSDYIELKDALTAYRVEISSLNTKAGALLSGAITAGKQFDEAGQAEYAKGLFDAFHAPKAAMSGSEAYLAGRQIATQLRDEIRAAQQAYLDAGGQIGDLGPDFTPLMITDEELARRAEQGRRAGGTGDLRAGYQVGKSRNAYVRNIDDPALRDAMGYAMENLGPNVVALNAREINAELRAAGKLAEGQVAFEEDPIRIATRYLQSMNHSIAAQNFLNTAVSKGVLVKDTPRLREVLREQELAVLEGALPKAAAGARTQVEAERDAARKALRNALGAKQRRKRLLEIAAVRVEADNVYKAAVEADDVARAQVVAARAAVRDLEPREPRLRRLLKDYFADRAELAPQVADAERATRNAKARASRVEAKLADKDVLDAEEAARLASVQTELQNEAARLAQLRANRSALTSGLAKDEVDRVLALESASDELVRALAAQRATAEARQAAWTRSRRTRSMLALDNIRDLNTRIDAYVMRRKDLSTYEATIPKSTRTAAQKAELNRLRALVDAAAADIKTGMNFVAREESALGKRYVKDIMRLADNLSEKEFQAARLISDEASLTDMVGQVWTADGAEAASDLVGNIYKTYQSIRDKVPADVLEGFTDAERRVLGGKRADLFEEKAMASGYQPELIAGGLRGVGAGLDEQSLRLPGRMRDTYAPAGVREILEKMYRLESDPTWWEKYIDDLLDPIQMVWKSAVTVGRGPAFMVNNMVGALVNNSIDNVSIAAHKEAAEALSSAVGLFRRLERQNPSAGYLEIVQQIEKELPAQLTKKVGDSTVGELLGEFIHQGGLLSTDTYFTLERALEGGINTAESGLRRGKGMAVGYARPAGNKLEAGFRGVVDFALTNKAQRLANDANQMTEAWVRFSAFLDAYKKTGSVKASMDRMYMLHFNYQDLSDLEQNLRRLIPFYTWTRNNVPLQIKATLANPGRINKFVEANKNLEAYFGAEGDDAWLNEVLPAYAYVRDGFATRFKFGGNNIAFFNRLPYQDLNEFFTVGKYGVPGIRGRAALNTLTPFVKTPIEVMQGMDLSTGRQFDERGVAVGGLGALVSYLPGQGNGPAGERRLDERTYRILQQVFPYLGTLEQASSAVSLVPGAEPLSELLSTENSQDRAASNTANVLGLSALLGGASTTLTPRTIRGELKQRGDRQRAELDVRLSDKGLDKDWLREQIKAGVPPEQIRQMIEAGLGTLQPLGEDKRDLERAAMLRQYIAEGGIN